MRPWNGKTSQIIFNRENRVLIGPIDVHDGGGTVVVGYFWAISTKVYESE
jgi:hypothetical protein